MNVGSTFVASGEASEGMKPSEGAFDDPAVSSESLTRFDATTGDARHDPRIRHPARQKTWSYALSACSLRGRRRGRPRGRRMLGILSSIGCSMFDSWALAGVSSIASGTPLPSTIRCCLVPSFPRSVGFGPVSWPPLLLARSTHRAPLATTQSDRLHPARRVEPGAAGPTLQPPANRATAASTSCRSRTPFPAASTPTRSPS
jgi:hypothetical protein